MILIVLILMRCLAQKTSLFRNFINCSKVITNLRIRTEVRTN